MKVGNIVERMNKIKEEKENPQADSWEIGERK